MLHYLHAALPAIPLVLLVLGSKQLAIIPEISVPVAMIIGVANFGQKHNAIPTIVAAFVVMITLL